MSGSASTLFKPTESRQSVWFVLIQHNTFTATMGTGNNGEATVPKDVITNKRGTTDDDEMSVLSGVTESCTVSTAEIATLEESTKVNDGQDIGKLRDGGSSAQTSSGVTSGTGIVAPNDDKDEREYTQTQTRHARGNETTGIGTSLSSASVKGSGEKEASLPKVREISVCKFYAPAPSPHTTLLTLVSQCFGE